MACTPENTDECPELDQIPTAKLHPSEQSPTEEADQTEQENEEDDDVDEDRVEDQGERTSEGCAVTQNAPPHTPTWWIVAGILVLVRRRVGA